MERPRRRRARAPPPTAWRLLLEDKPLTKADPEQVKAAMLDGVRQLGLGRITVG